MFRFPALPPVAACCRVCPTAVAPAHAAADAPPDAAGDSVLTLGKVQGISPLAAGSNARSAFGSVDSLGGDCGRALARRPQRARLPHHGAAGGLFRWRHRAARAGAGRALYAALRRGW